MKKLLLWILLLKSFDLFAQSCPSEVTLGWIMSETNSSHPRILLGRLNVEKIEAGKAESGKMINPELEHFSVWGKEFGGVSAYQNESRLWFTWQLAGKRQKSLSAWANETEMARHEEEMLKQALLKDLWLNFFRMHQINKEIEIKKTLIEKLEKILSRYKQRKFLSPDQSLEERIFTMVVDNFSLAFNQLERERINILSFFKEITGFKCAFNKIAFEENKIKWPKIEELQSLSSIETMNEKLSKLNFNYSESKLNLADSKKIQNLRFSPVVQNYINDSVNNSMIGISFVFPLPLFDRNQSDRMQSVLETNYAKKIIEVTKVKENYFFETKIEKYSKGLSVLKEVAVIDESLTRFKNLGDAFLEGKLSISNIVEFCRQLDEILHRYHQGESILMNDLMDVLEQRSRLDQLTLEHLI